MKTSELRQLPKAELDQLLKEKREKMRGLRFDLVAGKLKNVREVRKTKKDISKILTLLKEGKIKDKPQTVNNNKEIK